MNPSLVSLPGTVGPVMTMQNAIVEAACLGHQWVGPEHVLLAILNEQPPTLAREALNDVGITYEQTRKRFLASLLVGQPPIRSSIADGATARPAPVFYEIKGWIEGSAAALGRAPDETTALWALCWVRPDLFGSDARWREVVGALEVRGITTPPRSHQLDLADRVNRRRIDVPIDRLDEIRRQLLSAGLLVGVNTDAENGQAWVMVDDLEAATRLIDSGQH